MPVQNENTKVERLISEGKSLTLHNLQQGGGLTALGKGVTLDASAGRGKNKVFYRFTPIAEWGDKERPAQKVPMAELPKAELEPEFLLTNGQEDPVAVVELQSGSDGKSKPDDSKNNSKKTGSKAKTNSKKIAKTNSKKTGSKAKTNSKKIAKTGSKKTGSTDEDSQTGSKKGDKKREEGVDSDFIAEVEGDSEALQDAYLSLAVLQKTRLKMGSKFPRTLQSLIDDLNARLK